jgi:hypothetical protein
MAELPRCAERSQRELPAGCAGQGWCGRVREADNAIERVHSEMAELREEWQGSHSTGRRHGQGGSP